MIQQALGYVHGAEVVHAPEPFHGRLRYMIYVLVFMFFFFFSFMVLHLLMIIWNKKNTVIKICI